jgi:RimJ/RimL family protein N-acetyltransferase
MIILKTRRLVLRSWLETDRDLFREINADPKVMEFFSFRRSHAQSDEMLEKLNRMISDTGLGFYAIALRDTNEPIGFCGLAMANIGQALAADTVEIGWRLAPRFWGNGYVTEAAAALLDFGFGQKALAEIVSFAVAENHRSTAVMVRLGMRHDPSRDFDHPRVLDTHPHLKRHVLYSITREQWAGDRAVAADNLRKV